MNRHHNIMFLPWLEVPIEKQYSFKPHLLLEKNLNL